MSALQNLQDIAKTARRTAREKSPDLDAVSTSIEDVVTHAFSAEVLTLSRINDVISAVRKGVDDSAMATSHAGAIRTTMTRQAAYRGICIAADESLLALGLAYADLLRLQRQRLSVDFRKALVHGVHDLEQQFEQLVFHANWASHREITQLHAYWFKQLVAPTIESDRLEELSTIPWSGLFLQLCGCEPSVEKNDVRANLMLLGLITSGVLTGLRAASLAANLRLAKPINKAKSN
jgi:hypothetical protein